MSDWQLQCVHCSQIFNAHESIWCKCSYQFPTKICPFCLKCFCDSKESYAFFWKHLTADEKRKNRIIGNRFVGEWLCELGILSEHEVDDIEGEAKRVKSSFFKSAYKLGYFSKEEIMSIKKVISYLPAELMEGIDYSHQNKEVWKQYRGIIVDVIKINNQNYYIVLFPMGTHSSSAFRAQEKLRSSIVPLYIELSFWKMIAEQIPAEVKEEKEPGFSSYSIKEWLYKLIDELIQIGKEEIMINADEQFNNKSNVYLLHNKNWVLHSISPLSYSTLLWGIRNLIPEGGRRFRIDYYVMMRVIENRIFVRIHPYDWTAKYQDCAGLQTIMKVLRLSAGLILINTGLYAGALGRTLANLAQANKYSVSVNDASLKGENTFLFKIDSAARNTGYKHIFLVNSEKEMSEMIEISQSDLVVCLVNNAACWKMMLSGKGRYLRAMNFWRFKKLCITCKVESNIGKASTQDLILWETNPNGCASCQGKGISDDILIFHELSSSKENLVGEFVAAGEIDWRDLSLISPECVLKLII